MWQRNTSTRFEALPSVRYVKITSSKKSTQKVAIPQTGEVVRRSPNLQGFLWQALAKLIKPCFVNSIIDTKTEAELECPRSSTSIIRCVTPRLPPRESEYQDNQLPAFHFTGLSRSHSPGGGMVVCRSGRTNT